jgi:hypothetical protein
VRFITFIFVLAICHSAHAQFFGGNADGYDVSSFTNPMSVFAGGKGSGHDIAIFESPINIFAGGVEDGYDTQAYQNSFSIFYGGPKDGYVSKPFTNPTNIFAGGAGDGYDLKSIILSFIWTGAVGTGWNVVGNWAGGIAPGINSNVIIPSFATNFPEINSGIMSIGSNPNGGIYLCKNLTVDAGAEMTFKINAFLENYNDLTIVGEVIMLNKSANAIKNLNAAKLTIISGGRLRW